MTNTLFSVCITLDEDYQHFVGYNVFLVLIQIMYLLTISIIKKVLSFKYVIARFAGINAVFTYK
jgi:hypothetical protein